MITQTSYPIFESGQVLTSGHLNDLGEYLEQQDRLTRSRLIGIGVVCGLEPSYDASSDTLTITGGAGVTSEGYLVTLESTDLTRRTGFAVAPPATGAADHATATEPYPFFFDSAGAPRAIWELLEPKESPSDGSTPTPLTSSFVADKVVLLYLECARVGLKSCDVNSCADKGSEMRFTLRKLLVSRKDAEEMLAAERAIAKRPVHRHTHPRYGLERLAMPKINPAGADIGGFPQLVTRVSEIVRVVKPKLEAQLTLSWQSFEPLVREVYPKPDFPSGPFHAAPFDRLLSLRLDRTDMVEYLYDGFHDAVRAYNEFLDAAMLYDAECCPNPDRFPKHLFLGMAGPFVRAFVPPARGAIKPLAADSGYGPRDLPAAFRHHFVPSPALVGGDPALRRIQSLHYRLYLLAYRFSTTGRSGTEIRITPSRHADAPLSRRALPFYYDFAAGDDLHRNWSYDMTVSGSLDSVPAYTLLDSAAHPMLDRHDGQEFCRVEGVVGSSLRDAVDDLVAHKRRLGLTFAIQPVYLGLGTGKPDAAAEFDATVRSLAETALRPYLTCRLGELNVLFLGLMSTLYSRLERALTLLANLSSEDLVGKEAHDDGRGIDWGAYLAGRDRFTMPDPGRVIRVGRAGAAPYVAGTMTNAVTKLDEPKRSIGAFYKSVGSVGSGNLFDRFKSKATALGLDQDDTDKAPLYQAVSLIDKIEGVLGHATAPSVGELDADAFTREYGAVKDAFAAYFESVGVRDYKSVREIDRGNAELAAIYTAVVSDDSDTMYASMSKLLAERLHDAFDSLRFENYATSHPGLEHRCGVERGGTLVLCFTHRDYLARVHGVAAGPTAGAGRSTSGHTIARRRVASPLDDFVVVADFCLPYRCCDSECEAALASIRESKSGSTTPGDTTPTRPVGVREAFLRGVIVSEDGDDSPGGAARPLADARLSVKDGSGAEQPVDLRRGVFSFSGAPGKYTFVASARRHASRQKTITLASGDNPELVFELPARN